MRIITFNFLLWREFYKCGTIEESSEEKNEIKKKGENKKLYNFVTKVCIPVFKEISSAFPSLKYLVDQIYTNMEKWELPIEQ